MRSLYRLLTIILVAGSVQLKAVTYTYIGNTATSSSINWSDPTMWQSNAYPGTTILNGDVVIIQNGNQMGDIVMDQSITINTGATFTINNGCHLTASITRTITNNGTINGIGRITHTAQLQVSNFGTLQCFIQFQGGTLTNYSTGNFQPSGVNWNSGTLNNSGTFNVTSYVAGSNVSITNNSGAQININGPSGNFGFNGGTINNNGSINNYSGGTFTIGGTFNQSNSCTFYNASTTYIHSNVNMTLISVQNGASVYVSGNVSVGGAYVNTTASTFGIGDASFSSNTPQLAFTGNFNSQGILRASFYGAGGSQQAQMNVSGVATVSGTLDLYFGYAPPTSPTTVTIMHSGSGVSGSFSTINTPAGISASVQYDTPLSGDITVTYFTCSSASLPSVSASKPNLCIGDSTSLDVVGGALNNAADWSWYDGSCGGTLVGHGASVMVHPTTTTTYYARGDGGCPAPGPCQSITITVNALPSINIFGATSTCYGDSVNLNASGGISYSWNTGDVTAGIWATPFSTTSYTVIGTDANGCSNAAVQTINVNLLPFVTINASATTVCMNDPVTLSGQGALFYAWDNGITDNATFNPTATLMYHVTGQDANGCENMDSIQVTVNPLPTITLAPFSDVCATGASLFLSGGAPAGGTYSGSGVSAGIFSPSFVSPGTYAIAYDYTDANGCTNTSASANITVVPGLVVFAGPDVNLCQGDSALLNVTVSGGEQPYTYQWDTLSGGNLAVIDSFYVAPSVTTAYEVTVSDASGCLPKNDNLIINIDASNNIGGIANSGLGLVTAGNAYLFQTVPMQTAFDTIAVSPLNALGQFGFNAVVHGNYLVKVVPDTLAFPTLIPTYYGDKFQWDSAVVINHNCMVDFTANVNVIGLAGGTGTGSISGFILEGQGFGMKLIGGHDHIMVPGGPIRGVDVKLGKNPGSQIQARTSSDTTGYYAFDSIPPGDYRIYVDIPGLPMDSIYSLSVTITDSSFTHLDYYADSNSVDPVWAVNVGIRQVVNENLQYSVYPNPASQKCTLLFDAAKPEAIFVDLTDALGRNALSFRVNAVSGKNEFQVPLTGIEEGIYILRIHTSTGSSARKLVVEKQ